MGKNANKKPADANSRFIPSLHWILLYYTPFSQAFQVLWRFFYSKTASIPPIGILAFPSMDKNTNVNVFIDVFLGSISVIFKRVLTSPLHRDIMNTENKILKRSIFYENS